MKNKSSINLETIKTNNEIVGVLKNSKKFNLSHSTIWISRQNNRSKILFALLVNKTQFKLSVTRNKIKRQLRQIILNSEINGGINLLIKPNYAYLKKKYADIQQTIINTILKYQNGK